MTDEQRAALAKDHLKKAGELIDKLIAAGAQELDATGENMVDILGLLDDLEFEEGNLISGSGPAVAVPATNEDEDEDEEEEGQVEEFREDEEEE